MGRGRKGPISLAQEHAEHQIAACASRINTCQIQNSVPVEIGRYHERGTGSGWSTGSRPEGAVAITQQDRQLTGQVRDGQIQNTVAIPIAYDKAINMRSTRRDRRLEGSIPVPQINIYRAIGVIEHGEVLDSVSIEVSSCDVLTPAIRW